MNRRKQIDMQEFDSIYLNKVMGSLFPKNNDCATLAELDEVVCELKNFSIKTKLQVRLLLKKHRSQLLDIDKEPLDSCSRRLYRQDLGDVKYLDAMRRQYWFCYPGLIRTALEIEYGSVYDEFSSKRDGI